MKKETKESLISFGIAILIFSIFLGFLLFMGCITTSSNQINQPRQYNIYNSSDTHLTIIWAEEYYVTNNYGSSSGAITKIFIPEDNVTCYSFDKYGGGGISCLAG